MKISKRNLQVLVESFLSEQHIDFQLPVEKKPLTEREKQEAIRTIEYCFDKLFEIRTAFAEDIINIENQYGAIKNLASDNSEIIYILEAIPGIPEGTIEQIELTSANIMKSFEKIDNALMVFDTISGSPIDSNKAAKRFVNSLLIAPDAKLESLRGINILRKAGKFIELFITAYKKIKTQIRTWGSDAKLMSQYLGTEVSSQTMAFFSFLNLIIGFPKALADISQQAEFTLSKDFSENQLNELILSFSRELDGEEAFGSEIERQNVLKMMTTVYDITSAFNDIIEFASNAISVFDVLIKGPVTSPKYKYINIPG